MEILENTRTVMKAALSNAGLAPSDLAAIGLANQRETTVVWDRANGLPVMNAIVWQDTRTDRIASELARSDGGDLVRRQTGLVPATYFSGGKLRWILDNVDGVRQSGRDGTACFGTMDTWLLWNLTGGTRGGRHATDVTNASRTMLMDLQDLAWADDLLGLFGVPREMLPEILSSSGYYGEALVQGPAWGRCRSLPTWVTNMLRWWASSASARAKQRTRMGQAIFCCSTRGPTSSLQKAGSSVLFATKWMAVRPFMLWKALSLLAARQFSG